MKRLFFANSLFFVVLLPCWAVVMILAAVAAGRHERETIIPQPRKFAPVLRQWEKEQGGGVKIEGWFYHKFRDSAYDYILVGIRTPLGDGIHREYRQVRVVIRNGKAVAMPPN
jgi:hypothetical protein